MKIHLLILSDRVTEKGIQAQALNAPSLAHINPKCRLHPTFQALWARDTARLGEDFTVITHSEAIVNTLCEMETRGLLPRNTLEITLLKTDTESVRGILGEDGMVRGWVPGVLVPRNIL
tara:strand:- start:98 stop:454 length:357 start_codon:yes stop_codon:yes gene_type:complete